MKRIFLLVLIVLIMLNVVLCAQLWRYKNPKETQKINNESIFELEFLISSMIVNSNLFINPSRQVKKENDTLYNQLNSLIGQPKLMFYYDEMSCSPCTDRELQKLDSVSKIIGSENVILLAKHTSEKNIYLLKRVNNVNFRFIFIDNILDIPIFNFQTNFYFVLDKDFITKFFFVPSKTYDDLNEIYYSRIIKYFQTGF
jgi:hypothetical protein